MTGRIHIYSGNGKGKTTAAVGLAVRAAGAGHKVLFCQFLKDDYGRELRILRQLDQVDVISGQVHPKFTWDQTQEEKEDTLNLHMDYMDRVQAGIASGEYDLIVLDEIFVTIYEDLLPASRLQELLDHYDRSYELVLTGRYATSNFTEQADYYTEMVSHRHPYDQEGLSVREGVDY